MIWSTIYTLGGEVSKSQLAKVKFEKFSNVTREKFFEIVTNYESLQVLLPEYFLSMRIISSREDSTLVEEHLKLGRKEFIVMVKHVVDKPNLHEIFFVGGDAKGTHIIEEFEELARGIRITVTVKFKPNVSTRLSNFFGKEKIENQFSEIFDKLIWIAEH